MGNDKTSVSQRKIRKCPHCKSNKGYRATVVLGGYQYEDYGFGGKLLNTDRQGTDDVDKWVSCLNCGKSIDLEIVKYNQ